MYNQSAIIIFVRHPVWGKVKTRLASTMGNDKALAVYQFLLNHTYGLIRNLPIPVYVYYADHLAEDDIWQGAHIVKKNQTGADLGARMSNAFREVLTEGYKKIVIIGSDCFELNKEILKEAFAMLDDADVVVGPAKDGGYYLLGMNTPFKNIFDDIAWGSSSVLEKTISKIQMHKLSMATLPTLTDVDTEADINFTVNFNNLV